MKRCGWPSILLVSGSKIFVEWISTLIAVVGLQGQQSQRCDRNTLNSEGSTQIPSSHQMIKAFIKKK